MEPESSSSCGADTDQPEVAKCLSCHEPLSAARLKAMPTSPRCVRCTERSGDVARMRRYDETIGDEVISTFFKRPTAYIAERIERLRGCHFVPAFTVEGVE